MIATLGEGWSMSYIGVELHDYIDILERVGMGGKERKFVIVHDNIV
jgi:hypothetical protein